MANIFGLQADTQTRDMQRGKVKLHLEHWQEESSKMRVHAYKCSPKYAYLRVLDRNICTRVEMGKKEVSHEHFKAVTTVACTKHEHPEHIGEFEKEHQKVNVHTYIAEVQKKSDRKTVKYLREQQMVSCKEAVSIHLKVFGVKCHLRDKDFNLRDYAVPSSGWGYMSSGRFSPQV